ncbi:MAG: 3-deoxy-7-phosphoheptulonate synthase, partial [Fusobacteriaceae bacterium]
MIIQLSESVTKKEIDQLIELIEKKGLVTNYVVGVTTSVLGVLGETNKISIDEIESYDFVKKVILLQEPYKKASRSFHPEDTIIDINGIKIGGGNTVIMAGPCSVESREQIVSIAKSVKEAGAKILRGGAYKPRTSPYAFQGLELEGLELLKEARKETGMPIVSEIMSSDLIDKFVEDVDIIQVGARNMQNFDLLKKLGKTDKPILLKRGLSATIEELLMAAEYIMAGGNNKVILCERGIRTYETYTRNTLDISAIPVLKRLTHLPIITDPSHATGKYWLVNPLSKASIAAGADGLIIEVHNEPTKALCDGAQSLKPEKFKELM